MFSLASVVVKEQLPRAPGMQQVVAPRTPHKSLPLSRALLQAHQQSTLNPSSVAYQHSSIQFGTSLYKSLRRSMRAPGKSPQDDGSTMRRVVLLVVGGVAKHYSSRDRISARAIRPPLPSLRAGCVSLPWSEQNIGRECRGDKIIFRMLS
jgi:hypothetical protein